MAILADRSGRLRRRFSRMWESRDVLKRRVPRLLLCGILLALAVSGCRTSPTVAAYVGDTEISVAELQQAVQDRRADPGVAAYADTQGNQFTRRVLGLLVQEKVYAAAAERYGVQVGDDQVQARIDQLLGGDDPATVFTSLAQQGIGRADVVENVRQQLVRRQLATIEGRASPPTEAELRARYEQSRETLAQVSFGYITVPDQPTADAVLARLTATPSVYPALAAQYQGAATLPTVAPRGQDQVPPVLAAGIAAAAPGTGFTTPVPQAGGVVVTYVAGKVYPSFEQARPQLEEQAAASLDDAGTKLVDAVRSDLRVTVNPRYGVFQKGQLVPAEGGVVKILGGATTSAAPAG